MFRRKRLPPELDAALVSLRTVVEEVEAAKQAIERNYPGVGERWIDTHVTIEEALAAYTAGAAWAGFAEGRFGRLAVGERADFLVLDADPLEVPPQALRGIRVLETWIGGQKVFDAAER